MIIGFLAGIFLKQNVSGSISGILVTGNIAGVRAGWPGTAKRHTDAEACPDSGIQGTVVKRYDSLRSDTSKPLS